MRSTDRDGFSIGSIQEGFLEEGVCVCDLREQAGVGHAESRKAAYVILSRESRDADEKDCPRTLS